MLLLRLSVQFSYTSRQSLAKCSLTAGISLKVLLNPFYKSKTPLSYPKILRIVGLIMI